MEIRTIICDVCKNDITKENKKNTIKVNEMSIIKDCCQECMDKIDDYIENMKKQNNKK